LHATLFTQQSDDALAPIARVSPDNHGRPFS
jgi:hypothetical protein